MAIEKTIASSLIEQGFLFFIVLFAIFFDSVVIVSFIVSLFYSLGLLDVVGLIINFSAPIVFSAILLTKSATMFVLTKTWDTPPDAKHIKQEVAALKSHGPPSFHDKPSHAQLKSPGAGANAKSGTSQMKTAGKQAAVETVKGGLQATGQLAQGEVGKAAKTTVKTGLKLGMIFVWLLLAFILEMIPYSEAVPWYTIWAAYVWFKVTFAEVKTATKELAI